jgi:hypothetical protein
MTTISLNDACEKYLKLLKEEDYAWARQGVFPIWFEMLLDIELGTLTITRIAILQLIQNKLNEQSN